MVFVEFVRKDTRGKDYFVGADLASILADTKEGTEFGGVSYSGFKKVDEAQVEALKFRYYNDGVSHVRGGKCTSYFLGNPKFASA